MAQKLNRARRRIMGIPISARTGCWIRYQLNLRNITLKTAAKNAGVGTSMVTEFLKGRKDSDRVKNAICGILNYPNFDTLVAKSYSEGDAS